MSVKMYLRLFFAFHLLLSYRCQLLDTFIAPIIDRQYAPLSALINTSAISTAIVRSLESPIISFIKSTMKRQIDLNMDEIRAKDLKSLHEILKNNENETKELEKKLEILEMAVSGKQQEVDGKKRQPTDCVYIDKKEDSGIYTIFPGHSNEGFQVFCDMEIDGGGWTVFQRRIDGSTDFYKGWSEYENGFGDLLKEFWLGNSKLHAVTSQGKYELRVDVEDFENNKRYAKYTTFSVGSKLTKYKMTVSGYNGDAGDSLKHHNGSAFTTKDRDNDGDSSRNCAQAFKGGWWYNNCHESNLNGIYLKGKHSSFANGINWRHWKGYHYSLKSTTMMTRKVK